MTAQQDEPQNEVPESVTRQDETPESDAGVQAPSQDTKERFRAALEAKRAGQKGKGAGAQDRDSLAGHAKDGAHGHKVFRRKSG